MPGPKLPMLPLGVRDLGGPLLLMRLAILAAGLAERGGKSPLVNRGNLRSSS
jgi:hypothetical protein